MATLEDEVRSIVNSFMQSGELFTALNVSNKVKLTLPFARHREVRDIVRGLFNSVIEVAGWARTPIQVKLSDGSTTDALLYHPLSDSWNLDSKYDDQQRQQAALQTGAQAPTPIAVPSTPVPAQAVSVPLPAKDQWAQLFNTQPSLFPRK